MKLYHISAEDWVTLIFPNRFNRANFVEADRVYQIPNAVSNFEFVVTEPFGVEMIKAIASTRQFSDVITGEFLTGEGTFQQLGERERGIARLQTRGLEVVGREEEAEYAEDVTVYTVIRSIPTSGN